MTWEMDWADRIEEERARSRTLSDSAQDLRQLLETLPPKARHGTSLRRAFKDACDYGLANNPFYADIHRDATARLRQIEELEAHGHPATIRGLVDVCSSLPVDAEPSSQGWRESRPVMTARPLRAWEAAHRVAPARPVMTVRRLAVARTALSGASFESSLEEVPNVLTGLSATSMTHALRALSRFRASSPQDVSEVVRLIRGTSNPWVGGVALTVLASSDRHGELSQRLPCFAELTPLLLHAVCRFPSEPFAPWGPPAPLNSSKRRQREHVASEARRAAAIVLSRIAPGCVARIAPALASSAGVVKALLSLGSKRVRTHALETLRTVQPPSLLAPVSATLLEHAASCALDELLELTALMARVPDADLAKTAQVLPPTRALLLQHAGAPLPSDASSRETSLPRTRQHLGLQVLLCLAGPDLDALLRDAQAFATGVAVQATGTVPVQVMGDTDAAKEARLDGLLDDVAAATRGLSGDGDDPLVELASRFVAAVEAPGSVSAKRHAESALRLGLVHAADRSGYI